MVYVQGPQRPRLPCPTQKDHKDGFQPKDNTDQDQQRVSNKEETACWTCTSKQCRGPQSGQSCPLGSCKKPGDPHFIRRSLFPHGQRAKAANLSTATNRKGTQQPQGLGPRQDTQPLGPTSSARPGGHAKWVRPEYFSQNPAEMTICLVQVSLQRQPGQISQRQAQDWRQKPPEGHFLASAALNLGLSQTKPAEAGDPPHRQRLWPQ